MILREVWLLSLHRSVLTVRIMVFDAHERAFAFFKGACARGVYDNMKTAVETIFIGKDRQYNRRFLQMCSHQLVEPGPDRKQDSWSS